MVPFTYQGSSHFDFRAIPMRMLLCEAILDKLYLLQLIHHLPLALGYLTSLLFDVKFCIKGMVVKNYMFLKTKLNRLLRNSQGLLL